MSRKLFVAFAVLGLSLAIAKNGPRTYTLNIPEPAKIGSAQLRQGDYRLKLDGSKAIFGDQESNQSVEVAMVVHDEAKKIDQTTITFTKTPAGDEQIQEIALHGTRLKLDFPN